MKRLSVLGLGAVVLVTASAAVSGLPGVGFLPQAGVAIAQTKPKEPIQVRLRAEKQVIQQDPEGKKKIVWQPFQESSSEKLKPGEVLRYTVTGENTSNQPIKGLVLSGPIPKPTVYVLGSAIAGSNTNAQITYSIDGGKSFVAKPTIKVKQGGKLVNQAAPASAYTHIRWSLTQAIAPATTVSGTYQVKVR